MIWFSKYDKIKECDTYSRQLFGNVSTHKHSLQVHPEILYNHPVLYDLWWVSQVLYPGLDLLLEGYVIPRINSLIV